MDLKLDHIPLELSTFSAQLQQHVNPAAPPPMKLMAARGLVPASPDETVQLLYQLHLDSDDMVASEAAKALVDLPENILTSSLAAQKNALVLDWVMGERGDAGGIAEALVLNHATDDRTIARYASKCDANMCDLIAANQVRILRFPTIIEQLYLNPNARMATVDRLIELAGREQVSLDGLPGLKPLLDGDPSHSEGGLSDSAFESLLRAEGSRRSKEIAKAAELEDGGLTRSEKARLEKELDAETEQEQVRHNLAAQIQGMSVSQKVRLATIGSRAAIELLVRDSNRLVHMAAIRSPRLQFADVKKMSVNKSLPDGVISHIASKKDWTKHYEIMHNLACNPKTPTADAMGFLNHLRTNDLKNLQRNRNVPSQISRQAKNLTRKRSGD